MIYATSATVDLCQIMLRDSAHLQEKDIEWVNKKRKKKNESPIDPLYTLEDVEKAMQQFVGVQYDRTIAVSYTHLRAHETVLDLVCRLLLEKKKNIQKTTRE